MDKDMRERYMQHLNDTAPDMDKLWNRIESRIDNTTPRQAENENKSYDISRRKRQRHLFTGITAAAAALIIAFAGTYVLSAKKNGVKQSSDSSTGTSYSQKSAGDRNKTADDADYAQEENAAPQADDEVNMIEDAEAAKTDDAPVPAYDAEIVNEYEDTAENNADEGAEDNASEDNAANIMPAGSTQDGTSGQTGVTVSVSFKGNEIYGSDFDLLWTAIRDRLSEPGLYLQAENTEFDITDLDESKQEGLCIEISFTDGVSLDVGGKEYDCRRIIIARKYGFYYFSINGGSIIPYGDENAEELIALLGLTE
ncbi:MAG: hypothetical protein IJ737_05835 [Ruminococcus sp.]|nr:hypothetical protein [Ruminococcus sp.]